MKKLFALALLSITFISIARAQNYNNLLNYYYNGTPTYGIKIKTNIPFSTSTQMPTIKIEGYDYGRKNTIGLLLTYYVYHENNQPQNHANWYFYFPSISSYGAYTPPVKLSNENGKVVIFLDDHEGYYQRFTVSAFAQGMLEISDWFQGWTAIDEALAGERITDVPYRNAFKGDITMPGGIWTTSGNVLIGKDLQTNSSYKLDVNGKVRANEVVVNTTGADFVFNKNYLLRPLKEVRDSIISNQRLPEIASAEEMNKNGLSIGNFQAKLLQKIEELTLYLIDMDKKVSGLQHENTNLKMLLSVKALNNSKNK